MLKRVLSQIIEFSVFVVGYESINRFFHPRPVEYLGAVGVAAIVGFLGNEAVARLRLKVGKEIGSAALIADGYHARADGLTSLAVLFSAIGMWLNFPLADPLIGLLITLVILRIAWGSCKAVFLRLLDAVDPEVVAEIQDTARQTKGILEVTDTRVRWLGHRLHAELNLALSSNLTIEQGHDIAMEVRHNLLHNYNTCHTPPFTLTLILHRVNFIIALRSMSTMGCLPIPIKGSSNRNRCSHFFVAQLLRQGLIFRLLRWPIRAFIFSIPPIPRPPLNS